MLLIICYEIYKFVRLDISQNNQKAKGSLRFPTLIIALCAAHEVEVNPSVKSRPPINLKFIVNNFTATEEQAPQVGDVPIHHSPIPPGKIGYWNKCSKCNWSKESHGSIYRCMQESANHREIMKLQQDVY